MYQYFLKKYYPFIIIVILIISNIVTYCHFVNKRNVTCSCKPVNIIEEPKEESLITVDIKGEIKKPGIYQLSTGSNVNDLIKIAGGIKKSGTTNNINLARILTDQSVIVIKKKGTNNKVVEIPCNCPSVEITKCSDNSIIEVTKSYNNEGESKVEVSSETDTKDTLININTASGSELMTLSGIGEAKAKSIIDYREKNGLFINLEDLIKVSGISETIFNKIKDNIKL